jgi:hypothetical protein
METEGGRRIEKRQQSITTFFICFLGKSGVVGRLCAFVGGFCDKG